MRSLELENGYLVKLSKGEKIIESLTSFLVNKNINSGLISGIGGACDIELGFYDLDLKNYQWKIFSGMHEVLSLLGNISIVDGKPFIHAHISISDRNFQSFGGHLKEATVGATLEISINTLEHKLARVYDDVIGLKLLDLPEE